MKPKYGALCIGLILAAVATILLIALPGSANLYVAYAFCLIGIAMMVAGVGATDDNAPASYALLGQVGWFLPVSLFISVVVLVLQGVSVVTLPVLWHCIVQIIPLAFAGIRVIAVYTGKQEIGRMDKRVGEQHSFLYIQVNKVTALQSKTCVFPEERSSEAQRVVKKVEDALRYSDPMSGGITDALDKQIAESIAQLDVLCSVDGTDQFITSCQKICNLIRERNNTLIAAKS